MPSQSNSLKPRKKPSQARSTNTVESIHEACIQVLCDGGFERLTTTRVALRAGVSVGSLYQYYPNKQSLLATVLDVHLTFVVEQVEAAATKVAHQPLREMSQAVAHAFVSAKFANASASRALYAVASEVQGEQIVARTAQRAQMALCAMLASAHDFVFDDLAMTSFIAATALVGPVQGALSQHHLPHRIEMLERHLGDLLFGYLTAVGRPRSSTQIA